jgi:hypothetical protein
MPISRPLLIALVAAVLGLVGFYVTQGSGDSDGAAPAVVAPPPVAQEEQARTTADNAAKPGRAARRRARAKQAGVPPSVARALDSHKTVVLFFRGSGSADDRASARAVGALRGQRGVVVFADRIGRLGRYRAVVGELGISQAPAIVVVDRTRSARVIQGYVDPTTLAQDVADAR